MGVRVEMWLGLVVGLWLSAVLEAQLEEGFYDVTCPVAEIIVKQEVIKAFHSDNGVAPGLLRMHFHDCFIRGCDGSVLIDSTPNNKAEKDGPPNNPSLRGFEVIDNAKFQLENLCPGVVSCADILAFAARDGVTLTGGLGYDVPAGRRDGRISLASDTLRELPGPTFNLAQITQSFARKGLTQEEMVTLSGAHTIGRSHCTSFTKRLFGFNSATGQDPTLDPSYAAQLKQQCPQGTNPSLVVQMNPSSPNLMDNAYYSDLLENRGLLTSDQTLVTDPGTASQVTQNANNGFIWQSNFASAMVKVGQIEVLTGDQGEIRLNCRVIN